MNKDFIKTLLSAHQECNKCPSADEVADYFNRLLGTLFPNYSSKSFQSESQLAECFEELKCDFLHLLSNQDIQNEEETVEKFFKLIPDIYSSLQLDVDALFKGDPAAKSRIEVIRSYPGFYAISAYRIAHELRKLGIKDIPRSITEVAHSKTGIDIHPGAKIGKRFCIDHGTGVVIGETTEIGNDVKIYQGVTLGALSVRKTLADSKRHPTIEDQVIIYSGATILGGETVIGKGAVIGGNVWLTKSVAPKSKVYYQSQLITKNDQESDMVVINES